LLVHKFKNTSVNNHQINVTMRFGVMKHILINEQQKATALVNSTLGRQKVKKIPKNLNKNRFQPIRKNGEVGRAKRKIRTSTLDLAPIIHSNNCCLRQRLSVTTNFVAQNWTRLGKGNPLLHSSLTNLMSNSG
jgi:hypothetical protein